MVGYKNESNPLSFDGFSLECGGGQLDSVAMPRFTSELRISSVEITNCRLPAAGNASVVSTLAALNVFLVPSKNELDLVFEELPPEPTLTTHHFKGLERLTLLSIGASADNKLYPSPGFLVGLPNLRSVMLSGVKIPPNELHNLPHSVNCFHRADGNMDTLSKTLSETLLDLPGLLALTHEKRPVSNYYALKPKVQDNGIDDSLFVYIEEWEEKKLLPFEQCARVQILILETNADELPERWVAACTQLEYLKISRGAMGGNPLVLSAKFLDGATALKNLTLHAMLTSLPDLWLQGAPNLLRLDLSYNRIHTFSR